MMNGEWRFAISRLLLGLSWSLSLLVVACEVTPSEQFTPQLVVHGLVLAGSPSVQANINRTYAIDESFDTMFPGVSGMVWRGRDTWPLANSTRDIYSTLDFQSRPAPSDTFGIRLAKDGLDTVYGHTVVPDSFRILFPREGDTVSISDSMVWTRSRDCAGYYMSLQSIERGDTSYYSLAIPNDTSGNNYDSLVFTLRQMVFLYLFEQGQHTLRLYALDTSYYDWVSAGGFGPGTGTGETTHLSGGLGVFGSAVGESLKVYVRPETTFGRRAKSGFTNQGAGGRMPGTDRRCERIGRTARLELQRPGQKSERSAPIPHGPKPKEKTTGRGQAEQARDASGPLLSAEPDPD